MHPDALEKALAAAWLRKKSLCVETEAVRLLNARASGTPRLVFELYGKHGILYDYESGLAKQPGDSLRSAAARCLSAHGWESFSLLDRGSAGEAGRSGIRALAGSPPETLVVREGNLSFRVEPGHPRNVGLFPDTRELRKKLGERARDGRVLNLFAYTGSLGIAALAGGAAEVTQVDVSSRQLDRARDNLRLNALPEARCRFARMDSERYLDRAAKKGMRFDHIVLDPPVFARFDGKVFRFVSDYFRLVSKCAGVLSAGGVLYAVTNYAGVRPPEFAAELASTFRAAGAGESPPRRVPLPRDFDLPPDAEDLPEGNAMIFQIRKD